MPASPPTPSSNCWAEIDLDALAHNVKTLQGYGPRLMAVLKADAYGHGIGLIAPALCDLGVTHYGVATAAEGAALREMLRGYDAHIYIMTATAPADAALIAAHNLSTFISSTRQLHGISAAAKTAHKIASVHLEIDTGIGRAGILPEQCEDILRDAAAAENIAVTGICTHFTWGENHEDARAQYALFEQALRALPQELRDSILIHAANSPAMLNVPKAQFGMVRPGLLLYGIAPTSGPLSGPAASLRPVLALRARVILVRDLPKGATISYGRTFTLDHPARIATIGIGYGDGYSRQHSNIGRVILPDGNFAPIRGRVCMDQLCIELPLGSALTEGDIVTLVGKAGGSELRTVDLAESIRATPHEITTCLTARVPRIAVSSA